MITIECFERGHAFKVTNDKTFQEMVVYPRNYDHMYEILIKLLKEFVQEN